MTRSAALETAEPAEPAEPGLPWSLTDGRTAFLATIGGGALLAWAWWQSSGAGNAQHARELDALEGVGMGNHATWTLIGVVAVIVIAAGNLSWILSGRMAIRARRELLFERLARASVVQPFPTNGAEPAERVTVEGSTRFHRPSCLLVRGKPMRRPGSNGTGPKDLRPCEMCEP